MNYNRAGNAILPGGYPGGPRDAVSGSGHAARQVSSPTAARATVGWLASLDSVIEDLDRLPVLTERRFLKIGATLQTLADRLREIEANSAAAERIMTADDTLAAIGGLGEIFDRLEGYFSAADRTAERAGASLGRILEELGSIHRLMEGFKGQVGYLRMLKMLTGILSAGHAGTGAGFKNVASDLGTLSQNVQVKSTAIIDKVTALRRDMARAGAVAAGLDGSRKSLGRHVLGTIRTNTAALSGMHAKCAGTAHDIAGRSGELFREVNNVVVSLQFQDITRQQMEHARESLAGMQLRLSSRGAIDNAEALTCELADVCALQSAQLTYSADELTAAVTRIGTSLQDISRGAASSAAHVRGLFHQADEVGQSSLADIESGLASVMSSFAENIATNGRLTGIMLAVTDAMAEISSFADDIDFLGSEIRLIALNAIVKAAQAGKDGAAFSVIAETVKRQSEEICAQALIITAAITTISRYVADMQDSLTGDSTGETAEVEAAQCREELTVTVSRLGKITDTLTELLARTDRAADSLTAAIDDVLATLDCREVMAGLRRDIIPWLDRLAQEARPERQNPASTEMAAGLDEATRRYTMGSERAVHLSFASARASGSGVGEGRRHGSPDGATADHFESNVEFF
jgi:methyl-accepting chemotaxis protein